MDASTGLLMAVKQVELPTGSAPNEDRKKSMLSALEREIELLKDLHHENIVQYHCESKVVFSTFPNSFLFDNSIIDGGRSFKHLPGIRARWFRDIPAS